MDTIAKNAPRGTPLKRKSLMPYSGGFFRFRAHIDGGFPAVDKRYSNTRSPLFPCMKRSLIWGYLGAWEMMSLLGRVWPGRNQPTGILQFFRFSISKTRSWMHLVTGYPDIQRILCAKNAPVGTPLKRKSLVPYSGAFSGSGCTLTVFFPRWTYYAHYTVHRHFWWGNGARIGCIGDYVL